MKENVQVFISTDKARSCGNLQLDTFAALYDEL